MNNLYIGVTESPNFGPNAIIEEFGGKGGKGGGGRGWGGGGRGWGKGIGKGFGSHLNYLPWAYYRQPIIVPICDCITHSEHPTSINYNPSWANNACDPNDMYDQCYCYSTCPDKFGYLHRRWYNCSTPERGGLGAGSTVCKFRE